MKSTKVQPNSETALMSNIWTLADAGGSVIQLRTREALRAAMVLRKHLIGSDTPHYEWDVTNGWRNFTKENFTDHKFAGDKRDFVEALERPITDLRTLTSRVCSDSDKIHYFVYVNPHKFLRDNPYCTQLIEQYAAILPSTNVCVILITDDEPLPSIAPGTVLVTDMSTPSPEELREVLTRIVEATLKQEGSFKGGSDLSEEDYTEIIHLGMGLTLYEFETHAAISIIKAGEREDSHITPAALIEGIGEGKTAVIKQSDILELVPVGDIGQVGGMQRLKDWVNQRSNCYSEEAMEFGVEPPKGAALVGVPGTGKSLVAKAIAGVFKVPLIRLDFGRVFSKYVGDSESRVRAALKMVEAMSPCVLFVDEIDKGLGGAGGGGDSGISSRVLGSFLTWQQENTSPVFTLVTANRVDGLPPELLRRGRFDQIFSVEMPGAEGRKEVLAIHLQKRKRDIADFTPEEVSAFIKASEGYVPAEIESAVKDAITSAFSDVTTDRMGMTHILQALKEMVPMSKAHAESISRITLWAQNHATPVEYTDSMPNPASASAAVERKEVGRIIRPTARAASSRRRA